MLVGLLVICLVFMGTTTVHGQALTPPAWVPTAVSGWTLAYNNYTYSLLDIGSDNVVSNWTQIWFKNVSNVVQGAVGVVSFEYKEDYFSKAVPDTVKRIISIAGAGGYGLPAFSGSTMWDLFKWMMGAIGSTDAIGFMDQKGNVTGADGAFSVNVTVGGSNFYLLYAYRNKYATMIFALSVDQTLHDWYLQGNSTQMNAFLGNFVTLLVSAFSTIMTLMTWIATFDPSVGAAPSIADIIPTGGIVPTAANPSSPQDVNTFADSYVALFPGGIPGYPVLLVTIASFFAVLVIVQKKRKAIIA